MKIIKYVLKDTHSILPQTLSARVLGGSIIQAKVALRLKSLIIDSGLNIYSNR